ncbi:unnamed protein product, partial [Didymodactylos carnosus]
MKEVLPKQNWRKDIVNINLLLVLYILQGITIGIASCIPLLLALYGSPWKELGTFSFSFWPFSLKLLWAPFIDSVFIKKFGRRKTWIIPLQLLTGLAMILLSFYISFLLTERKIYILTIIFFALCFLTSAQDVAVDGWAITLLSKENVGWAGICNMGGLSFGRLFAFCLVLTLGSTEFSNKYIRRFLSLKEHPYELVSFSKFLLFCGSVFLLVTALIILCKREQLQQDTENAKIDGLYDTYSDVFKLFKKSCVRQLALISLTYTMGFAATFSMTNLTLVKNGVRTQTIGLMDIPLALIKVCVTFSTTRCMAGSKPVTVLLFCYIPRIFTGLLVLLFVHLTPQFSQPFQWYYYLILVSVLALNEIFHYSMMVALIAFFAQISDPKIGGTYMTLLNTV